MSADSNRVNCCSELLRLANLCLSLQPSPVNVISLTRLLTDLIHTKNYVRCVKGMLATEASDEELDKLGKELDTERAVCRRWATEKVIRQMVVTSKEVGLRNGKGMIVNKFRDIGESWATDWSSENQERLFQVMFGMYDRDLQWSLRLEQEFMNLHNIAYSETPSPRRKGCYERIIASMKTCKVKSINRAPSHGLMIRISRDPCTINDKNRYHKRPRGVFVPPKVSEGE